MGTSPTPKLKWKLIDGSTQRLVVSQVAALHFHANLEEHTSPTWEPRVLVLCLEAVLTNQI